MRVHLLLPFLLAPAPGVAQDLLLTAHGDEGDQLGWSVAAIGDVDQDGTPDWAVGAPQSFSAKPGATGFVRILSGRTGAVMLTLSGGRAQEDFGYSVAGAGDVDRDGHADILVGARFASGNGETAGAVTLFSGKTGQVLVRHPGPANMSDFGAAVAGAGDADRDGVPDLLVGAPADDSTGRDSGSVFVFSGRDGSLLHRIPGEATQDRFGSAVSALGDVDGDRHADFLVGAPRSGDSGQGKVYTFSGRTGQLLHAVPGAEAGGAFGSSLARAGELNGDGIQDWIAGAPSVSEPGGAQVHSGREGALLYSFTGDWAGGQFGLAVAGAGDTDRDGFADLAVGAPRDGGGGIDAGLVRVYSGRNGAVVGSFYGLPGEQFGASLAGYEAFTGSGGFLAGSPGSNSKGRASGVLRVYRGPQKMPVATAAGDYDSQDYAVQDYAADSTGAVETVAYDDGYRDYPSDSGSYSVGLGYSGGSTSFSFYYGSPSYYWGPSFYRWYPFWWYYDCWSYWYGSRWNYWPRYGWGYWSWGYCGFHGYYGHGYCGHHHHNYYDDHYGDNHRGGGGGKGGGGGGGGGNPPPPKGPTKVQPGPVAGGGLNGAPGGNGGGALRPTSVTPRSPSGGLVSGGAKAPGGPSPGGLANGGGKNKRTPTSGTVSRRPAPSGGGLVAGAPNGPGALPAPSATPKRLPRSASRTTIGGARVAPTVSPAPRKTMPPAWGSPTQPSRTLGGAPDLGGQSTLTARPGSAATRSSGSTTTRGRSSQPQIRSGASRGTPPSAVRRPSPPSTPRSSRARPSVPSSRPRPSVAPRPSSSRGAAPRPSRPSVSPGRSSAPRPSRSSVSPSRGSSSRSSARPSSSRGSSRSSARPSSSRGSSRGSARSSSRGGSRGRGRGGP